MEKGVQGLNKLDGGGQKAFDEIKARLCSGLSLHRVNPDRPFVLRTDASDYAIGARD